MQTIEELSSGLRVEWKLLVDPTLKFVGVKRVLITIWYSAG